MHQCTVPPKLPSGWKTTQKTITQSAAAVNRNRKSGNLSLCNSEVVYDAKTRKKTSSQGFSLSVRSFARHVSSSKSLQYESILPHVTRKCKNIQTVINSLIASKRPSVM